MEIFLLLVLLVSVNEEKGKEEGKNNAWRRNRVSPHHHHSFLTLAHATHTHSRKTTPPRWSNSECDWSNTAQSTRMKRAAWPQSFFFLLNECTKHNTNDRRKGKYIWPTKRPGEEWMDEWPVPYNSNEHSYFFHTIRAATRTRDNWSKEED